MTYFNIRVYGILINDRNEILLSDEQEYGMKFTKFPGGGLESGEGAREGLRREYQEECSAEVDVLEHIHTTDTYIKSFFDDSQVISIYYRVKLITPLRCVFKEVPFDFDGFDEPLQAFRWVSLTTISEEDLTFEMDRQALRQFMKITE